MAYFLHKKRDFLSRVINVKKETNEKQDEEYENTLKFIAGETEEGKKRLQALNKKREKSLEQYGIYNAENDPKR